MRRLRLACFVLAGMFVLPSLAYATPSTAAEYRDRVTAARVAVEDALPHITDEDAAHDLAEEVGMLLPAREEVSLSGSDVSVNNDALHTSLRQLDDAGNAQARRRLAESILTQLDSQRVALGATGTAPPHDEALLDRILEDEGVTEARSPENKLLAELQKFIDGVLNWLMAAGDRPAVRSSFRVAWYALLALSALAVVWIASLIIRRLRASGVRRDTREDAEDLPVVTAAEGLPDDALAFADAEAAGGRFREAVRALFGGAARDLVVRGVVPRTRTRTTRELLGDVGESRPKVLPSLRLLADAFEPAWYGHVDPGSPGYADARAVYVALSHELDAAGEAS